MHVKRGNLQKISFEIMKNYLFLYIFEEVLIQYWNYEK